MVKIIVQLVGGQAEDIGPVRFAGIRPVDLQRAGTDAFVQLLQGHGDQRKVFAKAFGPVDKLGPQVERADQILDNPADDAAPIFLQGLVARQADQRVKPLRGSLDQRLPGIVAPHVRCPLGYFPGNAVSVTFPFCRVHVALVVFSYSPIRKLADAERRCYVRKRKTQAFRPTSPFDMINGTLSIKWFV